MASESGPMLLGGELTETGEKAGRQLVLDPSELTTHGVILGMTGSGKTGLAVVLLEEALLRGIPALILDPKGDLGNLLLNFPGLRPEDFRPWIDEGAAARAGETPDQLAAKTAERWKSGLTEWGQTPERMRQLGMAARFTVFTPGATAGVGLDVVGSLKAPGAGTSPEARADEIEGFVSGLLALVGREGDPLSSPDHILLSNLIARAWDAGQDMDLAALIGQCANPPIRKLGVFELDTFFPPKERMALAVQLNSLLASPSFAPWMRGVPADMERVLFDAQGKPRAAIVFLAHLSEPERQFVVTLLLSRMVSWMRRQPGTSSLRALVYMDEVAGYAPPTAQPPSKKPMLTLFKQARAQGIGMVLSTQNPVDLDYKAMANAGTWIVGRLQTERDKARVLEGLRSAAGVTDVEVLDRMIGGLGARQFLLHSARGGTPRRFATRWSMSYLRGPLTVSEVERLMADDPERAGAAATGTAGGVGATSPAATTGAGAAPAAEDELTAPPTLAAGVRVRYMDPAAAWAGDVGADPSGRRLQAAVAARVHLRFDDTAAGIDHTEEYECLFFPLTDRPAPEEARAVDYDERDLRAEPPAGAVYVLPQAPIDRPAYFKTLEKQLKDYLFRTRSIEAQGNAKLKLFSRVGESPEEFAERCKRAAADKADQEAATLRTRYQTKLDRLQAQQRAAEDRLREAQVDTQQRVQSEIISGAGQLLSAFLGGRSRMPSLSGAASRRAATRRSQERLETVKGKQQDLAESARELEEQLASDVADIQDRWDATAGEVQTIRIPLEQTDVSVEEVVLVWLPTA